MASCGTRQEHVTATASPTLLRWGIAAAAAVIIIAGCVYVVRTNPSEFDVNFFAVLVTALLPAAVFVIGVRTLRSTVQYGLVLLGVTAVGWAFILQDDAMGAVGAVLAFLVTLGTSAAGAFHDHQRRRSRPI